MAAPHASSMTDWQRVWKLIDQRRESLGMSWASFYNAAGVSQATMYKMRDQGTPLKTGSKQASLCLAIGWTTDSVQRALRGADPQVDVSQRPDVGLSDLIAVVAELSERVEQMDVRLRKLQERPAIRTLQGHS